MTATAAEQNDLAPGGAHARRWLILGVICLAQLTVLLDNTVLNVAIPSLSADLHASTADVQWMINAYALVQSGLVLTAGSSADRYGRKKMLVAGLALFGVGSLAAGLAQSSGQLIAARAGMGVGGALLMTTTLAVVVQIFDDAERVKAIGIWSTVSSLGFAAGPLIGGVMLDHFWWGAIFLVNIPVAVVGLVAVVRLVPESRDPRGERPDLVGAVLSTLGMTGSLFLLTQHLQFVLGYEPLEAGLRTAPLALTVVALNLTGLGARLVVKLGTPAVIAAGMSLLAAGLAAIALLGGRDYGGMLLGLLVMGAGVALAMPAMANAIMSAIPPEKAGVGAGVNGTLAEFGNGLGVAVLGAVLNSRFAALVPGAVGAASLPAALAAADGPAERERITDAFASGLETSQLVGALAVLAGGLLAGALLRRAERTQAD